MAGRRSRRANTQRRANRDGRRPQPRRRSTASPFPQEAIDRIAEVVSPGSSVIISDEPLSKETGKGTDFIVLMSGEPQGGIKIRRRPQPWGGDDEYGYRRPSYGRSPYWGGGGSPFRW